MKPIREFFSGLKSLFIGMGITLRQFFKPTITLQYPHESLKMPKRFRGHIELVRDQETGRPLCYACTLCQKACPSDCIMLEGAKMEGEKKKSVTKYVLDFTKCSLCGACVEVCPDDCIQFSNQYNLACLSKDEYLVELFKMLEDESRSDGFPPWPKPPAPGVADNKAAPASARSGPPSATTPVQNPGTPRPATEKPEEKPS